mmetsp:Transcript_9441/g.19347  ORF Transcript_9441/g.19347 Transcript_9441/m.19347 type:complete len:246 (-) Transcript_9441:1825-2562(-)
MESDGLLPVRVGQRSRDVHRRRRRRALLIFLLLLLLLVVVLLNRGDVGGSSLQWTPEAGGWARVWGFFGNMAKDRHLEMDFDTVRDPSGFSQGVSDLGKAYCVGGHAVEYYNWYPRRIHCAWDGADPKEVFGWNCRPLDYNHLFVRITKLEVFCGDLEPPISIRWSELCHVEFHIDFNGEIVLLIILILAMLLTICISIGIWILFPEIAQMEGNFMQSDESGFGMLKPGTRPEDCWKATRTNECQ